jgi:hypothetical protein
MRLLMKILLSLSGFICALASMWSAVCIFGMWFIGPPHDPSMTLAHDALLRAGMTGLLIGASIGLALLSRLVFRKARAILPK